jgi:NAD(P)-dependent dehydrogenase (short-subunit alcohol dehydrogenase family)
VSLIGKNVLITGAARRIGRRLALAVARAGGNVIIHYGNSRQEAEEVLADIQVLGGIAHLVQGDLRHFDEINDIFEQSAAFGPLFGLVNNASIFEPLSWKTTDREAWDEHLTVNLTAPFFLSQAFARQVKAGEKGRIINLLDWSRSPALYSKQGGPGGFDLQPGCRAGAKYHGKWAGFRSCSAPEQWTGAHVYPSIRTGCALG